MMRLEFTQSVGSSILAIISNLCIMCSSSFTLEVDSMKSGECQIPWGGLTTGGTPAGVWLRWGLSQSVQASLELASKTIYCLLGSDSLRQSLKFRLVQWLQNHTYLWAALGKLKKQIACCHEYYYWTWLKLIDIGLGKVDSLENQKVVFEKYTVLNWKPVERYGKEHSELSVV